MPTPGWASTGEATAAQYGVDGWPALTDPGPTDRGLNLFSGGPSDAASSLTQIVSVSQFASSIDTSHVTYVLSGWLGGWEDQGDNATLTVTFQSSTGSALGTGSIGPVTPADRANATGLLQRSSNGQVPPGTRSVLVSLVMVRSDGTANDGYADDLSLVFRGVAATSPASACPANGSQPTGAGGAYGGTGGSGSGGGATTVSGGTTSTGGTTSSGGVSGGGTDGSTSTDVQRLIAELDKLAANQSADLNGDGVAEVKVTVDPSGTVTWSVDQDHDGTAEYIRTYQPSTKTAVSLIDADQDGFAEIKTTKQPENRVIERDTDGDQVYDWRRTDTYDRSAGTIRTVLETAPSGDGKYSVVSDTTSPLRKAACPPPPADTPEEESDVCDKPMDPATVGNPNDHLGSNRYGTYNNYGATDGADGSCSAAHSAQIAAAFYCALQRLQDCLSAANNEEAKRMYDALASSQLAMSCSNHCGNAQAAGNEDGTMSWNPDSLDKISSDEACSVALHEMMHWAGSPDDGANHGAGDDLVYSCGRYCGGSKGCAETDRNTPKNCGITPARDCAACAGTSDEKARCGQRTTQVQGDPWPGICHQGLGCIAGGCEDVQAVQTEYCDGTVIGKQAVCCNSCPADCNQSNDFPCTSTIVPQDKCKTPDCQ